MKSSWVQLPRTGIVGSNPAWGMGVCRPALHCLRRYIPIGQSCQMSNRLNATATSTPSLRWQTSNSQETKNSTIINHRHNLELQSTRQTPHTTQSTPYVTAISPLHERNSDPRNDSLLASCLGGCHYHNPWRYRDW
jgi:hypothetical protein